MKFIITLLLAFFSTSSFAGDKITFLSVPVSDLAPKHIGCECIISTDIKILVGLGSEPPEDMIMMTKEGAVYRGRLDEIARDSVAISATAGVPSDPAYRKSAT